MMSATLRLLLISIVSVTGLACAPAPGQLPREPADCFPLRGRVVVERANPLVPGGVQVVGVEGVPIRSYRVTRVDSLPPGSYDFIVDGLADPVSPERDTVSGTVALDERDLPLELRRDSPLPARSDADGWFSVPCVNGRTVLGCFAPGFRGVFRELPAADSAEVIRVVFEPSYVRQVPEYVIPAR